MSQPLKASCAASMPRRRSRLGRRRIERQRATKRGCVDQTAPRRRCKFNLKFHGRRHGNRRGRGGPHNRPAGAAQGPHPVYKLPRRLRRGTRTWRCAPNWRCPTARFSFGLASRGRGGGVYAMRAATGRPILVVRFVCGNQDFRGRRHAVGPGPSQLLFVAITTAALPALRGAGAATAMMLARVRLRGVFRHRRRNGHAAHQQEITGQRNGGDESPERRAHGGKPWGAGQPPWARSTAMSIAARASAARLSCSYPRPASRVSEGRWLDTAGSGQPARLVEDRMAMMLRGELRPEVLQRFA